MISINETSGMEWNGRDVYTIPLACDKSALQESVCEDYRLGVWLLYFSGLLQAIHPFGFWLH